MFADPQRPMAEQVRAYEHHDQWVNRMILGDSLVVMNCLLRFEGLGGQVQMIYIDPPYGVKFGSQLPAVRAQARRDDMRRCGHDARAGNGAGVSRHLAVGVALVSDVPARSAAGGAAIYCADRKRVCADFSDDNLHHVREVMDEVFGAENFCLHNRFRKD